MGKRGRGEHPRKCEAVQRVQAGENQADVAKDIGVSRATLSAWQKSLGLPKGRSRGIQQAVPAQVPRNVLSELVLNVVNDLNVEYEAGIPADKRISIAEGFIDMKQAELSWMTVEEIKRKARIYIKPAMVVSRIANDEGGISRNEDWYAAMYLKVKALDLEFAEFQEREKCVCGPEVEYLGSFFRFVHKLALTDDYLRWYQENKLLGRMNRAERMNELISLTSEVLQLIPDRIRAEKRAICLNE